MSIIQEALKRQEEEGAQVPDPPQEKPQEKPREEPRRRKNVLFPILISAVVLISAAAGSYILYQAVLLGFFNKDGDSKAVSAGESAAEAAALQAPESEPTSNLGRIVSKVEGVLNQAEENVEDGGQAPEPPPAEPEPAVAEEPKSVAETEPAEQAAPPAPREPVLWPKMYIKGIMAPGSGNNGTVLIGDRMLSEGDGYMGVRVLKISREGVLLEYKGERRVLSTGQAVGS